MHFVLRNPCTAERINNLFPKVHRERVAGTSAENRAYVLKDGPKYNKQEDGTYSYTDSSGKDHNGVNYSATFEEWGEMPQEQQGKSKASETIVAMVKDGASNREIVNAVAVAYKDLDKIERMRSMYGGQLLLVYPGSFYLEQVRQYHIYGKQCFQWSIVFG